MTNIDEAIIRAPATERIAAFLNGELVGSVLPCHRSFVGDDPEIRLLSVLPAFRPHRITRQLMDECERRVRRMGKPWVALQTTNLMSIARAWYERSGYSRFGAIDFSPVPGFLVMGFAKDLTRADAPTVNSRAAALDSGTNRELKHYRNVMDG